MIENKKLCSKCVYFIGVHHKDPRFDWAHCKRGVQNLMNTSAQTCRHYSTTIKEAIDKRMKEFKERMDWLICPYCGSKL